MNIPMTLKKSHSLLFHYLFDPLVCFLCKYILRHIYLILFSSSNQFWLPTCSSVRHGGRKEHFSFQKLSKIFCSIYKGKSQNSLMRDRQLSGIPGYINQQLPFYIAPQWHFHMRQVLLCNLCEGESQAYTTKNKF